MVINTNMPADSGARLLGESTEKLNRSLARLSSGSKLTSPEDDAGGLAVSIRFDAQINRISAAKANVQNAISLNQTQDGFLQKVGKALDRMSELSVLAQDVTKTDTDRALYNEEFQELATYVNDLKDSKFNDVTLFGGDNFQVTSDSDGNKYTSNGINLNDSDYSAATGSSIGTVANAQTALTNVKAAIVQLATDRSNVGANISVLKSYSDQLSVLKDNISAANSRIKDVDVAEESTEYARWNILVQSGTAMLAQANSTPSSALRLLS